MIEKKEILDAYYFRHACKIFDEHKKISQEDIDFIMETGRLSPSSFGMEPWRFILISNNELKAELKPHCWGQAQITSCSHLLIVLTKTAAMTDDSYISAMFSRRGLDKEAVTGYIEKFKTYLKEKVSAFAVKYMYKKFTKNYAIYEWCARQTYIAASSMATSAAMIGIDSCYIEGFKKEDVEHVLEIDTNMEEAVLVMAFGYRANEQPKKQRLSMDQILEIRA